MKGGKWKTWIYRLGILTGALLFLIQAYNGVKDFQTANLSLQFFWMALISLGGMVLVIGFQIINFRYLLKSLDVEISLFELSKGFILSSLPKYIPGSVWIFLSRSQWLNQNYGISHSKTNLANLLEIDITLVSAGGVLLLGLGVINHSWLYLAAAIVLPATILALTRIGIRFIYSKGWLGQSERINQARVQTRFIWLAAIISFLEWLIFGGATLLLIAGMLPSVQLDLGQWVMASQSFTLAWLAGFFIVFVPGGLGVRELVLTGLLISNFQANFQAASMIAVGSRFVYSIAELFWLGIGLLQTAIQPKKKGK